ncbi:MAG: hypothetical protein PF447_00520 [Spirochaetaceae bacterium]|nr:hypothetical protein [Spirochaetaceae bacterium]
MADFLPALNRRGIFNRLLGCKKPLASSGLILSPLHRGYCFYRQLARPLHRVLSG